MEREKYQNIIKKQKNKTLRYIIMTSGTLIRVFSNSLCKKETNQKVKALREKLELKEKDIEKKGYMNEKVESS